MLKIQCPSCLSHYKVEKELIGQFVECSSCETQFIIDDEHVDPETKKTHYPVHKKNDLSSFSKTFEAVPSSIPTKNEKHEKYLDKLRQEDFLPRPAWKRAINFLGFGLFLAGGTLLILGALQGGFLTGVGLEKRFIISSFLSLTSCICFFLGSKSIRQALPKCLLVILTLSGLAYYLPKYDFPSKGIKKENALKTRAEPSAPPRSSLELESLSLQKIKKKCRYKPVTEAIQRAQAEGDLAGNSVVALWVGDVKAKDQYAIQNYFQNVLGLKNRPNYYPRKSGALIILENITEFSIQEIAEVSNIFGTLDDVFISDRLISTTFNEGKFLTLNTAQNKTLNDPTASEFYVLNFQEVMHFDSKRVLSALSRLENAEPRFTSDALDVFKSILKRYRKPKIVDSASLCIMNWFPEELKFYKKDLDQIIEYQKKGNAWSKKFILLLLSAGSTKIKPIVLNLWESEPNRWESVIIESKVDLSAQLVKASSLSDRTKNLSIINILKKSKSPNAKKGLRQLSQKLGASYAASISNALRR